MTSVFYLVCAELVIAILLTGIQLLCCCFVADDKIIIIMVDIFNYGP